jgi:RNA polymerase-binding transcription factor DksA
MWLASVSKHASATWSRSSARPRSRAQPTTQTVVSCELAGVDKHTADTAMDTMESEMVLSVKEGATAHLKDIERAFGRIEDGSYGRCLRCSEPIPEGRLEAKPGRSIASSTSLPRFRPRAPRSFYTAVPDAPRLRDKPDRRRRSLRERGSAVTRSR